ncbi:MAG TPA: hypothetical protein VNX65_00670 [Patescibacteria group bacterium]|jgi:hypothetical protein|nr:hypothetical protein [Patescibacteria group bacterium]
MSRVVYIGGVGNGTISLERVTAALIDSPQFDCDDVDAFPFAYAMDHPDEVRDAALGVDAVAHSGGILPLKGTYPKEIIAFGSPLPTKIRTLLGRTVGLIAGLHLPGAGLETFRDIPAVGMCDLDIITEFGLHPRRNLRRLGEVSVFNAIHLARDAVASGIPASLVYTRDDEYFKPTREQMAEAEHGRVRVMTLPTGVHAELVLRPAKTLAAYKLMLTEAT